MIHVFDFSLGGTVSCKGQEENLQISGWGKKGEQVEEKAFLLQAGKAHQIKRESNCDITIFLSRN